MNHVKNNCVNSWLCWNHVEHQRHSITTQERLGRFPPLPSQVRGGNTPVICNHLLQWVLLPVSALAPAVSLRNRRHLLVLQNGPRCVSIFCTGAGFPAKTCLLQGKGTPAQLRPPLLQVEVSLLYVLDMTTAERDSHLPMSSKGSSSIYRWDISKPHRFGGKIW